MTEASRPDDIRKMRVRFALPSVYQVTVQRDRPYRLADDAPLTMDLYYPPDRDAGAPLGAVVIVAGFPDRGFEAQVGCKFKEMGSSVSGAELIASSGVVAITYSNREPAADGCAVLEHLCDHGRELQIDPFRIGLLASSGNAPLALSLLREAARVRVRCATLAYPFTMDLQGSDIVARASAAWGFVNPLAGESIDALRRDVPLMLVRAGQDQFADLNAAVDRFVAAALSRNVPITLVNHPTGSHAFDLSEDTATSREIVKNILAFTRFYIHA